jgi:hypothetical protein
MKLFGRKRAPASPPRPGPTGTKGETSPAPHRLTLELRRAETFAIMLAKSRGSRVIEVADLLAGMYVCNWDRLSGYWDGGDTDGIELFLRGICRISPQRWHSWIELYDRERGEGEKTGWKRLLKKEKPSEKPPRPSAALASVFKQAGQIAPSYDRLGDRSIPILTSQCVLLCIVRSFGTEVGKKLVATGLDADKLQYDALFPRHAPRGGASNK